MGSSSENTGRAPTGDLFKLGANLMVMLGAVSLDRRRRPSSISYSSGSQQD